MECRRSPRPSSAAADSPIRIAHAGLVARTIGAASATPALVVVQGDTSSAFGGALGAAMAGIPVAHVEAGLRSHDRRNPWPEEDFRIGINRLAELLLAPTALNAANLRREGVRGAIHVTGNTGIDALLERCRCSAPPRRLWPSGGCSSPAIAGKAGVRAFRIAACLVALARRGDVAISVILHPNPAWHGDAPLARPRSNVEFSNLAASRNAPAHAG